MAKIKLLVWTLMTGVLSVVLLRSCRVPAPEDPAAMTMAVVQGVAGVLAAYLCVATVLAVRLPRLAPSFVRRMVAVAIGGGLLLAPVTASAQPSAPPSTIEVPVLRRVTSAPVADAAAPSPPPPSATREVVIAPGDHLWAVAERTLSERLGRAPTDAEIVPFWTRLIDANRDRLIGGDPDLVFPGQRFVLPS